MVLIVLQTLCCALMTGLIWTIQVVHYPSFKYVSELQFKAFHAFHSRSITFIVLPVMALELVTAVALLYSYSDSWTTRLNFVAVVLLWASTFFISVPLHNRLTNDKDSKTIDRLVLTNWIRTFLWSGRLCLLVYLVFKIVEVNHVNFSE